MGTPKSVLRSRVCAREAHSKTRSRNRGKSVQRCSQFSEFASPSVDFPRALLPHFGDAELLSRPQRDSHYELLVIVCR